MKKMEFLTVENLQTIEITDKLWYSRYSRMDQVKFMEDSLYRPYHFKFFKGCLPHILLVPFLNTLTQISSQMKIQWGNYNKKYWNTWRIKRENLKEVLIALMKVGRQSYRFKFEIKGLYWKTNYIGDKIMSSKTLYGLMKLKSVIILR